MAPPPSPKSPFPQSRMALPPPPQRLTKSARRTTNQPFPSSKTPRRPRRKQRRAEQPKTTTQRSRANYKPKRTRAAAVRHGEGIQGRRRHCPRRRPRRRARIASRTKTTATLHLAARRRRRAQVGKEGSTYVAFPHPHLVPPSPPSTPLHSALYSLPTH